VSSTSSLTRLKPRSRSRSSLRIRFMCALQWESGTEGRLKLTAKASLQSQPSFATLSPLEQSWMDPWCTTASCPERKSIYDSWAHQAVGQEPFSSGYKVHLTWIGGSMRCGKRAGFLGGVSRSRGTLVSPIG